MQPRAGSNLGLRRQSGQHRIVRERESALSRLAVVIPARLRRRRTRLLLLLRHVHSIEAGHHRLSGGGWVEERVRGDTWLFERHARRVRLGGRTRTLSVARRRLIRVCVHRCCCCCCCCCDILLSVAVRERDGRVVRRLEILHERVNKAGRVCG